MDKTRRELLRDGLFSTASILSIGILSACGRVNQNGDFTDNTNNNSGSNSGGNTANNASCSAAQISANHGHTLTVSAADVQAGVQRTYSIQGRSGHPHTITLNSSDFAALAAGNAVTVSSSFDAGHTHQVVVTCS